MSRRGGQLSSLPARRPPEKGRCSRQWGTRCPHHRRPLMSMPCQTCRCAPARPSSRRTVQGTMEETGKVRGRQADAVTIVLCTAGVWAAAQPAPRRAEGGQGPPQVCADCLVPEKQAERSNAHARRRGAAGSGPVSQRQPDRLLVSGACAPPWPPCCQWCTRRRPIAARTFGGVCILLGWTCTRRPVMRCLRAEQ